MMNFIWISLVCISAVWSSHVFFFRWVFVERYSAEEAKNYAFCCLCLCSHYMGGLRLSCAEIFENVSVKKVHVDSNTMLSKLQRLSAQYNCFD